MSKVIDNIEDINAIDAKVAKVTSTDNAIARFDGTGGAIQNSGVIIDDSGNVGIGTSSITQQLTLGGYGAITGNTGNSSGFFTHQYLSSGSDCLSLGMNFRRTDTSSGTIPNAALYTSEIQLLSNGVSSQISFNTGTANTVPSECMRIDSSGNLQFNSGYGSVATAYACRAWVNFNGTGTVAIRASGNVSSIADNGTGNYTVNFTNAFANANYSAITSSDSMTNGGAAIRLATLSTSSLRIFSDYYPNTSVDGANTCVAIFR